MDSDNLVQITRLDCNERGHDLGGACHWCRSLAVLVIQDMPRIVVKQDSLACRNRRWFPFDCEDRCRFWCGRWCKRYEGWCGRCASAIKEAFPHRGKCEDRHQDDGAN